MVILPPLHDNFLRTQGRSGDDAEGRTVSQTILEVACASDRRATRRLRFVSSNFLGLVFVALCVGSLRRQVDPGGTISASVPASTYRCRLRRYCSILWPRWGTSPSPPPDKGLVSPFQRCIQTQGAVQCSDLRSHILRRPKTTRGWGISTTLYHLGFPPSAPSSRHFPTHPYPRVCGATPDTSGYERTSPLNREMPTSKLTVIMSWGGQRWTTAATKLYLSHQNPSHHPSAPPRP